MREDRVIALAGMAQALSLVRAIALRGSCDAQAMRESLASVLRLDADSAADVYGGIGNLRHGLRVLIEQLDRADDADLSRMALAVLRLERRLARRPDMLERVRNGVGEIAKALDTHGGDLVDLPARLAQLYAGSLSHLRPRVMVEGSEAFLQQPARQNEIRALLFAAIRAAVLWRQLGGSPWRLMFRRRQYAMLARGLLTRCTLDGS